MEIEYEERILKTIVNVGKYILYIDFSNLNHTPKATLESVKNYIIKYPHIITRIMDPIMSHKVKEFNIFKYSPILDKVI